MATRSSKQALRESEEKFRTLAETTDCAIFVWREGLIYVNPALSTITGYTRDELLVLTAWEGIIHPDDRERVRANGRARLRGEDVPRHYEFRIYTKSGEERWVDFTAGTIRYNGDPAVLGTAFDVTDRKRAEQALRESETLKTSLLRAVSHVWATIPAWESYWRPYALGRAVPFTCLPVTNTVPVVSDAAAVAAIRARLAPAGGRVVGHIGTFASAISAALRATLPMLLARDATTVAVLLGRGGDAVRDELARRHPGLATRVHATGMVPAADLSLHLQACDLAIQPYPDGVTSRRTTVMALLAHGVPVATTLGALTEPFWRSVDAVSLVPAGDSPALATERARLLEDAPSRARLAQAARTVYAERFDVARMIAVLRPVPPAVSRCDAGRVPA
jgi:PAS domain S-box-containing protein